MLHIKVGDEQIAIPGELLAQAVFASMPDFLTGKSKGSFKEAALRSAINGVLPMLLAMIHEKIAVHQLPIAAPNLRAPEARENMIRYAIDYLFANGAQQADSFIFELVGARNGDEIRITGFSATGPGLAETVEPASAADGELASVSPADAGISG